MDRLIDQHDRNVVFDRVHQPAGLADQAVVCRVEMNIPLTLRARENIQKIFANRPEFSSFEA